MSDDLLQFRLEGKVAVLQMDDGKANALSSPMQAALRAGLERAQQEASAVVIAGREGRFSGGFDLSVMKTGPEAVREMVGGGGVFLMDLFVHPQPVVAACTGHAIAAAALTLLASDTRVGAAGPFKIGMNEVSIGMSLPEFATALLQERISKRHLTATAIQGRMYAPDEAVDAGFLDAVHPADQVLEVAIAEAARLAELPGGPYASIKRALRGQVAERVRKGLEQDMSRMTPSG